MSGGKGERTSPTWPTAASAVVGIIGDPVTHSLSPLLHNAAFDALGLDWVSVAFPVPAGRLADALTGMRALGVVGLSVTMPHKQEAAALVDECSPAAHQLHAVNCITRHDSRLTGDSTDGPGFVEALRRGKHFDPAGRRCLVVGAGGAARAVILALAEAGAQEVVVLNRSPDRAVEAAALAGPAGRVGSVTDVPGAELVVQATPVGMAGTDAGGASSTPFDASVLHDGQLVAELVYHPLVTPLMASAAARGADTVGGLGMLVHQAALAIERWTGRAAPVDDMWAAADRRVSGTEQ